MSGPHEGRMYFQYSMARHIRFPFGYFLLITALYCFLGRVTGFFIPLYFREIGFSGVHTGLFFSVSSLATILLSLPAGVSTDRFRASNVLLLSFGMIAAGYVGFLISRSLWVFCVFSFVGSLGGRFYSTASTAMFFKICDTDSPVNAGIFQCIHYLAAGCGAILGAWIIFKLSYRHAFAFAAASNGALMLACLLLPRTTTVTLALQEYRSSVLRPRVLIVALVFFLSSAHWGAEMVAYAPFLRYELGLSMLKTGLYTGGALLFVGVGAMAAVLMHRKGAGLQWIMFAGLSLGGVFQILMCVQNPWLSFAFRAVHEIGDGMVWLGFYYGVARIFRVDRIGGCSAFISLWMGIAAFSSALFYGWLGDVAGYRWPMAVSGVSLLLAAAVMTFLRRERIWTPENT
jgi:MFS family permease